MTETRHDGEYALTAIGLAVGYRNGRYSNVVSSDISLNLPKGTVTCLLGPNGAGKSTLLRTLSRQQPSLSGVITVNGRDLKDASISEVAKMMSVVYTERTNTGAMTVREVASLGRQPYTGFFGRLSDEDHRIVDESLAAVGVLPLSDRYMATLSDGERQKVMIARALAQRTPVMILDEPTSFLDVASRLEIMGLLRMSAERYDTAVLLSTHDVSSALAVASRLWLMYGDGHFVCGTTPELVSSGHLARLFEGRGVRFSLSAMDFRLSD